MTLLIGIALPVLGWGALIVYSTRKRPPIGWWYATIGLNFAAIAILTVGRRSDLLWICAFCAVVVAVLLIFIRLLTDYDLIMRRYWQSLARIWQLATTYWWAVVLVRALVP